MNFDKWLENMFKSRGGILPRDVDYFTMPVNLHFGQRPFHARSVRQEWKMRQLREDMADKVMRSHLQFDYEESGKTESTRQVLFRIERDVFCHLDAECSELTVYAPAAETANKIAEELAQKYAQPAPPRQPPSFYLLKASKHGFCTEPVALARPLAMSQDDLALHYGPDTVQFEQKMIQAFDQRKGGATIFRGEPGVGKTNFIRHLMAKLSKSHMFYYLPVAACDFLTSPNLVEFWLGETRQSPDLKKVVVLEDAEDLLKQRNGGNREKVASLLNVADGLLGDFLQMHLICTVNCEISKLDPAITRPGRLLAYREFKRLSREQAMQIATAKGIRLPEQKDYSLAEIYTQTIGSTARGESSSQTGFAA